MLKRYRARWQSRALDSKSRSRSRNLRKGLRKRCLADVERRRSSRKLEKTSKWRRFTEGVKEKLLPGELKLGGGRSANGVFCDDNDLYGVAGAPWF